MHYSIYCLNEAIAGTHGQVVKLLHMRFFLIHLSNHVLHDRKVATSLPADNRGSPKCETF